MTNPEKRHLQRVNFSTHESGHICAALHQGLFASAEIRIVIEQIGSVGARTFHYGGTREDDLFAIFGGIACTKYFHLGEAGLLKDFYDAEQIVSELPNGETAKQQAEMDAEKFVRDHTEIILKMAYALYQSGELDEETTEKIYAGEIGVTVPAEFVDALDQISKLEWRVNAENHFPIS